MCVPLINKHLTDNRTHYPTAHRRGWRDAGKEGHRGTVIQSVGLKFRECNYGCQRVQLQAKYLLSSFCVSSLITHACTHTQTKKTRAKLLPHHKFLFSVSSALPWSLASSYIFRKLPPLLLLSSFWKTWIFPHGKVCSRCKVAWCYSPVMLNVSHKEALLLQLQRDGEVGRTSALNWTSTGDSRIRKTAGWSLAC